MADPLQGILRPGESSEYHGPTYREDYTEWGRWWDFSDFSRWTQEQKNEHQHLIEGLASDLLAEMAEWDPDDPLYEAHCEQYRGMLSRLDYCT